MSCPACDTTGVTAFTKHTFEYSVCSACQTLFVSSRGHSPVTISPKKPGRSVAPTFRVRDWLVLDAGFIAPITGPQPRAFYAGVTYNIGAIAR